MKIKLIIFMFALSLARPVMAQLPMAPEVDTNYSAKNHLPGSGILLYKGKDASLRFSTFVTYRYLNNKGLENTYTDYFGRTKNIQQRSDAQLQKVMLYFSGFMMDPKFRYMLYVWTANTSQGLAAQVVVAGNLQYKINKYVDLGIGVGGLPSNRSLYGQWPAWLRQDARPMGEEFFRASFTTGIWASGDLGRGFNYRTMLGNNLSQLGIDAGQLDDQFDSWSTALWWLSDGYGKNATYGDFEQHEQLAGMFGVSYTRSTESAQSQAGSEAPENSQIRLSDGTNVFGFNSFNDSSQLEAAQYQMFSANSGIKWRGFSWDVEFFFRTINDMKWKSNKTPVKSLVDIGYTTQLSYMILPERLQLYGTGSVVDGQYGKPWEVTTGLNIFPFKTKTLRINPEYIFVDGSPVGYTSYPTLVGATGSVFMINLELYY